MYNANQISRSSKQATIPFLTAPIYTSFPKTPHYSSAKNKKEIQIEKIEKMDSTMHLQVQNLVARQGSTSHTRPPKRFSRSSSVAQLEAEEIAAANAIANSSPPDSPKGGFARPSPDAAPSRSAMKLNKEGGCGCCAQADKQEEPASGSDGSSSSPRSGSPRGILKSGGTGSPTFTTGTKKLDFGMAETHEVESLKQHASNSSPGASPAAQLQAEEAIAEQQLKICRGIENLLVALDPTLSASNHRTESELSALRNGLAGLSVQADVGAGAPSLGFLGNNDQDQEGVAECGDSTTRAEYGGDSPNSQQPAMGGLLGPEDQDSSPINLAQLAALDPDFARNLAAVQAQQVLQQQAAPVSGASGASPALVNSEGSGSAIEQPGSMGSSGLATTKSAVSFQEAIAVIHGHGQDRSPPSMASGSSPGRDSPTSYGRMSTVVPRGTGALERRGGVRMGTISAFELARLAELARSQAASRATSLAPTSVHSRSMSRTTSAQPTPQDSLNGSRQGSNDASPSKASQSGVLGQPASLDSAYSMSTMNSSSSSSVVRSRKVRDGDSSRAVPKPDALQSAVEKATALARELAEE